MNLLDVLLLLFLFGGLVFGFKRGFLRQSVSFVGLILAFVLAFRLKNVVAIFLYERLPFFNFNGIFKGISSINIIIYELIAFVLVFSLIMIIIKLIGFLTGAVEKILNSTIILGIPSKILGAALGFLESYVLIFIVTYILVQPIFNFNYNIISESRVASFAFNNTPLVSNVADDYIDAFEEIVSIKDSFSLEGDKDKLNKDVLTILLKYDITTIDSLEVLAKRGKIDESIINDIKEEE